MPRTPWLLVAAILLFALACSAPQPATRSGEDGSPKAGGIIKMRLTGDPYDYDMSYSGKGGGMTRLTFLYESLLGFKIGPDTAYLDQVLVPELAESWEASPDAK